QVTKNNSFYASLRANFTSQEPDLPPNKMLEITPITDLFEQNQEINSSAIGHTD
ncbi:12348_t:CDS:2, partial [Cetraspora pellucida]